MEYFEKPEGELPDFKTFGEAISEKLSGLSPRELAILYAEGTLDKTVRPTITDIYIERITVANYLLSHPEIRNSFYKGLIGRVSQDEFNQILIDLERPVIKRSIIPSLDYPLHEN